jgi:hypothetical protein
MNASTNAKLCSPHCWTSLTKNKIAISGDCGGVADKIIDLAKIRTLRRLSREGRLKAALNASSANFSGHGYTRGYEQILFLAACLLHCNCTI